MKLHIPLIPLIYFLKILGDYTENFTEIIPTIFCLIINTETARAMKNEGTHRLLLHWHIWLLLQTN